MFDIYEKSRYVTIIHILFKNYSCCKILEEDIVVKLRSEQMRSEEIRSEHGARSTELHGCYRRLLLHHPHAGLLFLENKLARECCGHTRPIREAVRDPIILKCYRTLISTNYAETVLLTKYPHQYKYYHCYFNTID